MHREESEANPPKIRNKFNPGGIEATLKRWYTDPEKQDKWVVFDGVSVILVDDLSFNSPYRSICLVSELGGVVGESAHLTLEEFLYNDF